MIGFGPEPWNVAILQGGFPQSLFAGGVQGAWYDPSDLSTLFQDAAGTTPVAADGDPVGLIRDKSGNGKHLTQATAANKPAFKTGAGKSWLLFDGINDHLRLATFGALPQPTTIAVAFKLNAFIGQLVDIVDAGNVGRYEVGIRSDAFDYYAGSVATFAAGDTNTHALIVKINGASSKWIFDGSSNTGDSGAGAPIAGDPLALGAIASTGATELMSGLIYQAIITNRALSAAEEASLLKFLQGKAGL